MLLLTLFAAIERHAINVLVEAYEREAQFGLLSIASSIELGQRATDERGCASVANPSDDLAERSAIELAFILMRLTSKRLPKQLGCLESRLAVLNPDCVDE